MYLRTFLYVGLALAMCVVIGYPVAYYVSRRAGRTKGLLLVLLILPFWVNYLLRMLAWIGLLQPEGWVNDVLVALGIFDVPHSWLSGNPMVVVIGLAYGYLPFFILPLYASLDRLDQRLIEAARDLGARPREVFRRVTLPLSMPGIVAATVLTALPMFGDYYTNSLHVGLTEDRDDRQPRSSSTCRTRSSRRRARCSCSRCRCSSRCSASGTSWPPARTRKLSRA